MSKPVNILLEDEYIKLLKSEAKTQNRSLRGHIKFIVEDYIRLKYQLSTTENIQNKQVNQNPQTNQSNKQQSNNITTLKNNVPNNVPKF